MRLSHPVPRMTQAGAQRVSVALEPERCASFRRCESTSATLTRRIISAAVQIHLQCDGCGRSLVGALSRKDHYEWQSYREWDADLVARRDAEYEAKSRQNLAAYYAGREKEQADRQEAWRARVAEYDYWCRTSPDWKYATDRVLWRSRGICEACLTNRASVVHHLTYQSGKLPPAWYLRAVCHSCHQRLHDADDEWCEPGMERT